MEYCEHDADLALRILQQLRAIDKAADMATVAHLPLEEGLNGRTSQFIDALLIPRADRRHVGVPPTQRMRTRQHRSRGGTSTRSGRGSTRGSSSSTSSRCTRRSSSTGTSASRRSVRQGTTVSPSGARFVSARRPGRHHPGDPSRAPRRPRPVPPPARGGDRPGRGRGILRRSSERGQDPDELVLRRPRLELLPVHRQGDRRGDHRRSPARRSPRSSARSRRTATRSSTPTPTRCSSARPIAGPRGVPRVRRVDLEAVHPRRGHVRVPVGVRVVLLPRGEEAVRRPDRLAEGGAGRPRVRDPPDRCVRLPVGGAARGVRPRPRGEHRRSAVQRSRELVQQMPRGEVPPERLVIARSVRAESEYNEGTRDALPFLRVFRQLKRGGVQRHPGDEGRVDRHRRPREPAGDRAVARGTAVRSSRRITRTTPTGSRRPSRG